MMEFGQIPWWKCWKSNWVFSETMVTLFQLPSYIGWKLFGGFFGFIGADCQQKHECYYKFLIFLIEVELLGQPTRN